MAKKKSSTIYTCRTCKRFNECGKTMKTDPCEGYKPKKKEKVVTCT